MAQHTPRVDIRLLGPLEVAVDGQLRQINGAVRRSVLVLLALHPGAVLDTQRLVDLVWAAAAPATAVNTLRVHISQLRRALGAAELIEHVGTGYRLALAPECIDVYRFEGQARTGRERLTNGDTAGAVRSLRAALEQWRGSALADVACEPATHEAQRWQQLRDEARIDLADAELTRAGAEADLAELMALAAERPFDERVWALLIKAEYWLGRQADALATYQRASTVLADELGLVPGPALRALQKQILTQDPALDPPPAGEVELPAFPTTFVGRGEHVKVVAELLVEHRLVTLTGLGGIGKTRLAVAAATTATTAGTVAHGAVFASFERISDPALLPAPLAEALGARRPTLAEVITAIGNREILIILDNCEQLVEPVADLVAAVMRACPAVKLLATSRIPLSVTGECAWAVPPLETPPPDPDSNTLTELLAVEAVALFVERARQACPSLALTPADQGDLAEVVRLLAGFPLGIELAAAQCSVLAIGDVAERLRTAAQAPTTPERDRPQRHHSMDAALAGSLQLLPPAARTLLVRMTVFHQPAGLAAVEQVCGGLETADVLDLLGTLVRAAVVNADLTGQRASYWLLSPVRQAAAAAVGRLGDEPADVAATAARHAGYFADLVRDAAQSVGGPEEPAALARVDGALADVRAALEYSVAHEPLRAMQMVGGLGGYWLRRRLHAEGRRWAHRALTAGQAVPDQAARAAVLHVAGSLAFDDGDRPAAEESLTAALAIWRQLDDGRATGRTLNNLAGVASDSGDHDRAYRLWQQVLEIFTEVRDELGVASTRTNLGIAAEKLGLPDEAAAHLAAALTATRALGNRGLEARVLERLAIVAATQGDHQRAKALSRAMHEVCREAGTPEQRWRSHWTLAMRHRAVGETADARRHLAAAARGVIDGAMFDAWWVVGLLQTAAALVATDQPARAARLLGLADAHRRRHRHDTGQATIDDLATVSQAVRDALGDAAWAEELTVGEVAAVAAVLVELAREFDR
ncbi:tetratricopeptide repeat protein [Natronosporangium hydrolyticum]|uniref:Tetratricopeptide repeat protein n=1 Tax=Natronosporangium hydrolyticum TaxID=2811111 RepID=A0A895YLL9_9ACTN|nr:BTAD domain-containing putative transcriptional regulator [Natronosporangium hydrolyticum]QSB16213.1 tetratricopeptide repeat protein [Natronosporangium hydrolyticum]